MYYLIMANGSPPMVDTNYEAWSLTPCIPF